MPLSTFSSIPPVSPLEKVAQPTVAPISMAQIALTDASHQGVIDIRGQAAEQVLRTLYDDVPDATGKVTLIRDGALARLRPDQFALLLEQYENRDALKRLEEAVDEIGVTVTDVTHGRAIMLLSGAKAAAALPKVCGLDFHNSAFPDLHAAQTSLAKVRTLILRLDEDSVPAYHLVVERSLGAYVWGVVYDAIREYQISERSDV